MSADKGRMLLWGGLALAGAGIVAVILKAGADLDEPTPEVEPPFNQFTSELFFVLRDAFTEDFVMDASVKIYLAGSYIGDAHGRLEGSTWVYSRVVPAGGYDYTVSAPGFMALEGTVTVDGDNLGKTTIISLYMHASPKWTATLYWSGADQIPFVVNGITYYGSWIKRALVPWDILLGETVQVPDAITYEGRDMVFSSFWARVYDRPHLETDWFKKLYDNPSTIIFPSGYARAGYLWQIQAKYDYV